MTRRQPATGTPMSGGTGTTGAWRTPEHDAYMDHILGCEDSERGRQCPTCLDLLFAADVADWRPSLAQARAERAVGATT